jgi:uncharacterized iron-regulated membrane protein
VSNGSRLVAAALDSHLVIGLTFSALIYLICLTGTLSVLVDELKLVEQPSPAAAQLQPGVLNTAVTAVLVREPSPAAIYARAPATPRQRLTLTTYGQEGEHSFIATASGSVVPQQTPFTDFVTNLHMTLTVPAPWGSLTVGIAGAALFALIVSGVIAHPRIFRDAFRLRVNGSRRLREAELHNRLSVWGLPFHIAVTLTGALFGLANLIILTVASLGFHGNSARVLAPLTGPTVTADSRPAPLPDLDVLVSRARSQLAGSRLGYVGVESPGTQGARITVELGLPGRLPRGEDFYFDVSGSQVGRGRYLTGPAGLQWYSGAVQVHFGLFGGLPVRLAYVVLGAALTFIGATGFNIWLERQAERGRPRPRLRGAWKAWTRGTLAALAVAALLSRWVPVPWAFWGVVLVAQVVALWQGWVTERGAQRQAVRLGPGA